MCPRDTSDMDLADLLADTGVPTDRPWERLDTRDLPPPEPLTRTLERLEALDEGTVLVQLNDRTPQHLYPRLTERGYTFETVVGPVPVGSPAGGREAGKGGGDESGVTVTAIWVE